MEVANTDRKVKAALIGSAGESHAVQVAGTREFIEMLSSNLYSRPKEAMIREILCNADDAHKEAGYDGPIEIAMDNDNTLTIRDRGRGIPHDKIHIIYGTYGGSTKKKDSMATGGFGLGCKSPWSYTDAFNVTNAHGGTKTINTMVRVSNDHGGLPAIVPIASFDTDETGIEVRIDIKFEDTREIRNLIATMVLRGGMNATFNGEQLRRIEYPSDASYAFVPDQRLGSMIMVKYGAVLYPVERQEAYGQYFDDIVNYMSQNSTLVLMATPDSLIISPNRENVSYLEKTQKQLFKLLYDFMVEINKKADPYARQLVKTTNESFIKRNGMQWIRTLPEVGYLDSPAHDKNYHNLDVFGKIIHTKLTQKYPRELHKTSLKQRFDLSVNYMDTPWKKKILAKLRELVLESHLTFTGYNKDANLLFKFICKELIKIAVREGYNQTTMRFGSRTQNGFGGHINKWTAQPQLLTDFHLLRGDQYPSQFAWSDAPVILSHTIKGVTELTPLPIDYFVLIIPRNGQGALDPAAVTARLTQYGLKTIDLTGNQKLGTGKRAKADKSFPTLGGLRKGNHYDCISTKRPVFDHISKIPKAEWEESPSYYLKTYIRSGSGTTSPMDMSEALYNAFQHLLPDDTAVVTTEADVAKLVKIGARSYRHCFYDKIVELWDDPELRRVFAWLPDESSTAEVIQFFNSPWYKQTFELPDIKFTTELLRSYKLLHRYYKSQYEFHTVEGSVLDTANMQKKIASVFTAKQPKKLQAIYDLLGQNPIVEDAVNIDELIKLKLDPKDPKVSDKASRILSIIME